MGRLDGAAARAGNPDLHLDGFDGPIDLLLELAEQQRIDLGRVSIVDLAAQFVAALARLSSHVSLERRADWLVMASRLVLLRSRLLFPASPAAAAQAERDAATELRRLEDLAFCRAAAAWLQARPLLGTDVFARPQPVEPRDGGYVALMEACLAVLRGRDGRADTAPVYRPAIPGPCGGSPTRWRGSAPCWPPILPAASCSNFCRPLRRTNPTAGWRRGPPWPAPLSPAWNSRGPAPPNSNSATPSDPSTWRQRITSGRRRSIAWRPEPWRPELRPHRRSITEAPKGTSTERRTRKGDRAATSQRAKPLKWLTLH